MATQVMSTPVNETLGGTFRKGNEDVKELSDKVNTRKGDTENTLRLVSERKDLLERRDYVN